MLTLVSLFDGIGGFPLAFERAGARTVATVEIDPAAAAVSARHFPNATQFDDVTKVTTDDLRAAGFVPDRGILTAGWPCQDFSVAGRRAGLDGARSGLWWEVVRILADVRPRWFLGENVPGLLSSVCQCAGDESCIANGRADECGDWRAVKPDTDTSSGRFRTVKRSRQVWVAHTPHTPDGGSCTGGCMETHGGAMGSVLGSLAHLGYGFAYRVLDAQHFGVPQRRERVFIVGHLGVPWSAPAQVLLEPESGGGDSAAGGQAGQGAAGSAPECVNSPRVTTVTGKPHTQRSRRCRAAGDAGTGSTPNQQRADISSSRRVVAALTNNGVGTCGADDNQAQAGHLVAMPIAMRGRDGGGMAELGQAGDPAFALRTGGGGGSKPYVCVTGERTHALTSEGADASEDGTGRGTPIVTFVPDIAAPLTAGTAASPGVNPPGRRKEDDAKLVVVAVHDVAFSHTAGIKIQASESLAPTIKAGHDTMPSVHTDTIVRRLTELECERLQGYPDGWTGGQSGSARHRQLGNSVAVPVVEWIAHRLIAVASEMTA